MKEILEKWFLIPSYRYVVHAQQVIPQVAAEQFQPLYFQDSQQQMYKLAFNVTNYEHMNLNTLDNIFSAIKSAVISQCSVFPLNSTTCQLSISSVIDCLSGKVLKAQRNPPPVSLVDYVYNLSSCKPIQTSLLNCVRNQVNKNACEGGYVGGWLIVSFAAIGGVLLLGLIIYFMGERIYSSNRAQQCRKRVKNGIKDSCLRFREISRSREIDLPALNDDDSSNKSETSLLL